jgi:cyanophycin synthetase
MIKSTSKMILEELLRRGFKAEVAVDDRFTLLRYFHDGAWQYLQSSMPHSSSAVGKLICDHKDLAAAVASQLDIPQPGTMVYIDHPTALAFMRKHGRIVVKPVDAAHGNGVTVGVDTDEQLTKAVQVAQSAAQGTTIILQQQVTGVDLRILIIDGTYVACAKREPAKVLGDGIHTLRELILHENDTNPERGHDYQLRLNKIDLDASERFLGDALDATTPAAGEEAPVVGTANIGTGGQAVDYTDRLPADLIEAAERFARATQIVACGVDFMWDEQANTYHFIEANACPSFYLHTAPSEGRGRPVEKAFVDALLLK